jgi:transcriptional regulator with XRE-family HTH domain
MTTKRKGLQHARVRTSSTMRFLENLTDPLTLGGLVEATRLAEGLSQVEFAQRLSVSKSYLCDLEKGRKTVSVAKAAEFARILGESEHQFVRLALQAQVDRAGLPLTVDIHAA